MPDRGTGTVAAPISSRHVPMTLTPYQCLDYRLAQAPLGTVFRAVHVFVGLDRQYPWFRRVLYHMRRMWADGGGAKPASAFRRVSFKKGQF